MEWVQPQSPSEKLNLIYNMEDGRQVGDSCIFLPSVTQLLEELSSLVSKTQKKGERKKKKILPALTFPCSVQTVQQRGKNISKVPDEWKWQCKPKSDSCRDGEKSSASCVFDWKTIHKHTGTSHWERMGIFVFSLWKKKRLKGALKIS